MSAAPTMNEEGGFIRLYRRVWENPVFRNKQEAAVFVWMVCAAQWRDATVRTKWGPTDLGAGELIIAERTLAEEFGLHRNTVRALLQRLVDDHTIELFLDRTHHRAGTVCRIKNYQQYQRIMSGSEDAQDRSGTEARTEEGPKKDRRGTKNKEEKEVKEKKEEDSAAAARASASPEEQVLRAIDAWDDPNLRLTGARVRHWIDLGADLQLDILPAVTSCLEKTRTNTGEPNWYPRGLNYFDGAVADAKARRTRPMPEGNPNASRQPASPGRRRSFAEEKRAIERAVAASRTGGMDHCGAGADDADGAVIDGTFDRI